MDRQVEAARGVKIPWGGEALSVLLFLIKKENIHDIIEMVYVKRAYESGRRCDIFFFLFLQNELASIRGDPGGDFCERLGL